MMFLYHWLEVVTLLCMSGYVFALTYLNISISNQSLLACIINTKKENICLFINIYQYCNAFRFWACTYDLICTKPHFKVNAEISAELEV